MGWRNLPKGWKNLPTGWWDPPTGWRNLPKGWQDPSNGWRDPPATPLPVAPRVLRHYPATPPCPCPCRAPPANPSNITPPSPQPHTKLCRCRALTKATPERDGASPGSSTHTRSLPALLRPPIPNDKRTNISLFKPNYLAAIYIERGPREWRGQPNRRLAP